MIGYTAPGNNKETNNFKFAATGLADDEDTSKAAEDDVWTAENKAKLNDCTGGVNWTISTNAIGSAGQDSYKAAVASTECVALTPTFDKIGQ